MPSLVYQNMVNLVVRLSISRCISEFMNVAMWKHHTFDNEIFGRRKIYYSTSITITNLVQTLIPNRWLENIFLTDFGIEIS
jgi:hypothetical protein